MADKKAQNFILKQTTAIQAVVDGLEAQKTLEVEYVALDYGTITAADLEGSIFEGMDPAVFTDAWNAFNALYPVFLTYKTVLYKTLP